MGNNYFKFKRFTVYHDRCAMKVGTDGVLIGAWAAKHFDVPRNILDIGCGCGVIALMAAQCSEAQVDAIEIDNEAAVQAMENFADSPWTERLTARAVSLQEYVKTCSTRYDIIVSNPPYFIKSLKNNTLSKTVARHTELLPFDDLIDGVLAVLCDSGSFFAIFPYEEGNIFIAQAAVKGLYCSERIDVRGTDKGPVKRIMLRMERTLRETVAEELVIEQTGTHDFSREYKALTAEFYLHF